MTQRITPVILSGGSGTRLWPLSRTERPKQLLALTAAETMLQLTARRCDGDARFAPPMIVANATHADAIERQMNAIGIAAAALILEPAGRNTAPAIALAALAALDDDPQAVLLAMPSDHVIGDVAAFHAAITAALPVVQDGWLATFGIAPDGPETGYGYIRRGEAIAAGVHRVDRFVEKPDKATAQGYLDAGCYAWNGGIFLMRAADYLAALERHAPTILVAASEAMAGATRSGGRIFPDPSAFAASPAESIDYAVMEKADRVAVAPVEMGWSDVGSWDAIHALSQRDEAGNVRQGEVIAIDTRNCLIRSEGPLVVAVGVADLVVVATADAVLVLPRGSSQAIKQAIDVLKQQAHPALDR